MSFNLLTTVAILTLLSWKMFCCVECFLNKPTYFHFSNTVFGAWHNEVLVSRQIIRHKARIEVKYGRIWKHKVDMMYTAKCVVRLLISCLLCGSLEPLPLDQFHGKIYEKSGSVENEPPLD